MADVAQTTAAVEAPTTSKKNVTAKKEKRTVSVKAKSTHPPTAVMVNGAIKHLKERGGSSLQAIKKYISATYKIDAEKFSPFIKKYLRNSVISGVLVQTKGKGASGSFKLAATTVTKSSSTAAPKTKKSTTAAAKTKAKTTEKKVATSAAGKKATAAAKGKKKAVSPVAKAKPKSPSKAKKTAKAPTKKPKSPKPKTTKAKVTKSAAKKASPKKK